MVGEFIMTEHECVGHKPVADGVGYGAYALDSHTCNRIVVEGRVENEGNYFIKGFDPYAISYRSLLPKRDEITNLVVPVCLSRLEERRDGKECVSTCRSRWSPNH